MLTLLVCLTLEKEKSSSVNLVSLSMANVEALASENSTTKYWCCGNTGECAIGTNYVIHGKLSESPCN